jgi:hypothetical protein
MGIPFGTIGSGSCIVTVWPSWTTVGRPSPEAVLTHTIAGLAPGVLYRWRARVDLAAPTGALPLSNPAHGPWRRLDAQTVGADVRVGNPVLACSNGIDDDGDGLSDYPADSGCVSPGDASERDQTLICDDGMDNDDDGLTDFPSDPACQTQVTTRESALCQDGLNNDNQTGIDFDGGASVNGGIAIDVPDPQCAGMPWRNTEAACGLGAELVCAIPLLVRWRRLRGRRATVALEGGRKRDS